LGIFGEASEVLIGLQDGDHVLLRNWRYAPEDWTYADVEIRCGPWQGVIQVAFYSDELARFGKAISTLYRELGGKAELHPFDSPFAMTLTGNGRGAIAVDGHARSDFATEAKLQFQFSIDQTFLPRIADSLIAASPR
jgi:hypothetical protein